MIAVTLKKKWAIIAKLELTLTEIRALEDMLQDVSRILELTEAKQDLIGTDFISLRVQDSLITARSIKKAIYEIKDEAISLGYDKDLHLRIVTDYS